MVSLVGQAREYALSADPFVPIIIMTWNAASELVNKVLNTGTDHLLMWPFSAQQLGGRVARLITARRPFVETESYLGPDRRDPAQQRTRSDTVEVPNALRAKVENLPALAPTAKNIWTARKNLEPLKRSNVARRIATIAKVLRERNDDAIFLRTQAVNELAAVQKSVSVIRETLAASDRNQLMSYCDAVEKAGKKLAKSKPGSDMPGIVALEKAAQALQVVVDFA